VILAAVYMLSVVQKVFFGPLNNPKNESLSDLNPRETMALAPLLVLVFVIGLFPNVILDRLHDSVTGVIGRYVEGRMAYQEHQGQSQAGLKPKKGDPTEAGYPEPAPSPEGEAPSLAAHIEEAP
jgi:NADH-quinone oxidoreductase subunit M